MELTLRDVHAAGSSQPRILLSILGVAYDVSSGREFFGPKGPYRIYAGHDCTYALASMSLKAADVDKFQYELDEDDRQTLSDWVAYFDVKYKRAGRVTDVRHPVSHDDLPKGKDPSDLIGASHPLVSGTDEGEKEAFLSAVSKAGGGVPASSLSVVPLPPASSSTPASSPQRLSRWLIEETSDLHEQALRGQLMQDMMQRRVLAQDYAGWAAALFSVYSELELQLEEAAAQPLVRAVDDERLRRLPNLREDLRFFYGEHWQEVLPSPSLFTIRYCARINDIADQPHRLVIHHWMRYGGGLAGGQFLRTTLKAGLKLKSRGDGTCPGIRYHQFDLIRDVQPYYEAYLQKIDALEVSEHLRQEMLEEARIAFELNIRLNDEFRAGAGQPAARL